MIIGVTGNKKEGKLKLLKYLENNDSFKYFDIDKIYEDILKKSIHDGERIANNPSLILKIKNIVDERINYIVDNVEENDILVLDYSLLENLFVFDRCDLLIRANFNGQQMAMNEVELLKKYEASIIASKYENNALC